MEFLTSTLIVGAGATALTDLWGFARKPLLGVAPPDYGLVGRWIGHMKNGRFAHDSIKAAAPVPGEGPLGWIVHYLIGITYAAILLGIWGLAWMREPTPGPALLVGLATVAAPFLVMQPAMGAGIASARAPKPASARLQSLIMHAVFGLGLYASGWLARALLA